MNIDINVRGEKEVISALRAGPDIIMEQLRLAMTNIKTDLVYYIQDEKLSGQVLNAKSGDLRASIDGTVKVNQVNVNVEVSTEGVPYAAIHEFGGQTSPHEIVATKASMLRFVMGGEVVFRKKVNHPGSNIPERSYMRSALQDKDADIRATIKAAMHDAEDKLVRMMGSD